MKDIQLEITNKTPANLHTVLQKAEEVFGQKSIVSVQTDGDHSLIKVELEAA